MQRFDSGIIAVLLLLGGCAPHGATPARAAAGDASPDTLNVADAAIAGGDPAMALSVSQSVLANDPNNPDALVHEGNAFYALGRCPSAEAVYRAAIAHGAKAAAQIGLGRCLLKTDPAAAAASFAQAVADDPTDAAALDDLGIARDLQGDFAGAVDPYRRALQADPGDVSAEVNLGLSLALSGNGPAALQYLGPLAVGHGATPKIREDYAAALVADGRDQEAQQVLGVDLPPDQVVSAMSGFASVIAHAQRPVAPLPAIKQFPAVAVPRSATRPVAVAAAVTPAPMPVRAAPPQADPPAGQTAGSAVQFAALNSPIEAERAWRHLQDSAPALFKGRMPEIEPAQVKGRTFYRLRLGGFPGKAAAARFCGEVLASGSACTPADF
ncbi:MAG: hypothetical protein B7Z81_10905 [Acidocella sp. 20-61-6]|nr:MAG: hypothetical protein B7Z81_10905 [Acidocella sp. 20-61-6]